jgi:hypothetical protein
MSKSKSRHPFGKPDATSTPAPPRITPELIEHTLRVWQPHSRRELSREDAVEIISNATGFFKVLSEWSKKQGDGDTDPQVGEC